MLQQSGLNLLNRYRTDCRVEHVLSKERQIPRIILPSDTSPAFNLEPVTATAEKNAV